MWKVLALVTAMVGSNVARAEATVPGQQAQKSGVRACQQTVEDVAKFVIRDNQHSSLATWNSKNPDARMFNAQVGIRYSDGNSVAVVSVAPTRSGKCDSSYTTVFAIDKSCALARETNFKDWKFSTESAGMMVLKNEDGNVSKILLPSGSGCVAVTSEVVYQ